MVQLGMTVDFSRQVLQWDGAAVLMKQPIVLLRQKNLISQEMRRVFM